MDKIIYEAHLKDIEQMKTIKREFIATHPEQESNGFEFAVVDKSGEIALQCYTKEQQDAESLRNKLIEFLNNQ